MWYFIRWTSDTTSKQEIADLFEHYIVSKEYSRRHKLHYHIVTESDLDKENLKDYMYNNLTHERRGVPTLKIDTIGETNEDLDQCATYSVKDDDYIYSSFFEDKIKIYIANSYNKSVTPTVAIRQAIDYQLDKDNPNFAKLWDEIALIKAQAGHEVYPSKITALVLSAQILYNKDIIKTLREKYFIDY